MENLKRKRRKRERGANYTPDEKSHLADLVSQYKHIIEDKRTGGLYVTKKRDAWLKIASKFNSCASTGPRSVDQLKMLYDNWKQKTRKKVAENNKTNYAITNEDLTRALEHVKEDKIQLNKTGGGYYKPKTTDDDDKILSIIKDQTEPLPNAFDSGAVYFRDLDNEHVIENEVVIEEEEHVIENEVVIEEEERVDTTDIIEKQEEQIKKDDKLKKTAKRDARAKVIIKKKKNLSAEEFKRIYFKRKCQVANLEKKKLMQEILQQKQQHQLKMQILKLQLGNLGK